MPKTASWGHARWQNVQRKKNSFKSYLLARAKARKALPPAPPKHSQKTIGPIHTSKLRVKTSHTNAHHNIHKPASGAKKHAEPTTYLLNEELKIDSEENYGANESVWDGIESIADPAGNDHHFLGANESEWGGIETRSNMDVDDAGEESDINLPPTNFDDNMFVAEDSFMWDDNFNTRDSDMLDNENFIDGSDFSTPGSSWEGLDGMRLVTEEDRKGLAKVAESVTRGAERHTTKPSQKTSKAKQVFSKVLDLHQGSQQHVKNEAIVDGSCNEDQDEEDEVPHKKKVHKGLVPGMPVYAAL